jgi:HK97 family phage prohead protease
VTSIHVRRLEDRVARTAARLVDHAQRQRLDVADLADAKLPWYEIRSVVDDPAERDDPGAEVAEVLIFDEIGGSLGVSAKQFAQDLQEITAPTIRVRINSPGGSVFDAVAIHNALLHHPAYVEVYVDSLAASAASVIAMAGDEVVMMPGSQMMIHDASAVEEGNAADHGKMQTFLDRQSDNIARFYQRRGGGDVAEWRERMLAETWMFADEAVEAGLADREYEPDRFGAEPDERMTRSFDLARYGYRYAGRDRAPAAARRRATSDSGRNTRSEVTMPAMLSRASSDAERRRAARVRADAADHRGGSRVRGQRLAPTGIGRARMAAFPAQLRAEMVDYKGERRYYVTGHASVVEVPYEMWDDHGPYMEIIDRGAFDKTLASNPDVAFLVNHRGVTMARSTNDSLRLEMDDVGLRVTAWLNPKRQDVSDLVTAVQDRDITEMSFAFMLGDDGGVWSPDFETFRIREADIDRGDVSAVTYGANPYTDVAARSREILADLDRLPAGAARAAVARLQARTDVPAVDAVAAELDRATRVDLGRAEPELAVAESARVGRTLGTIEALLLDS